MLIKGVLFILGLVTDRIEQSAVNLIKSSEAQILYRIVCALTK